jgi:hypothetical protein
VGFNFATGATAPALRGLTVQSTLAVADGLRLAPYPLADDGQRNFVDLNTIPNTIEEKIVALHHQKRDLADSLLEGTETSTRVSAEDLMELLRDVGE